MTPRRYGFLWVLFACLLVLPVPATAQEDPATAVFGFVNNVRASQGLPPFRYQAALAAAAQNQANWMASTGIYSHTQTDGSTPYSRAVAAGYPSAGSVSENIVGGTKLSPRGGVIWWENSPVHYNTMVSTRYVEAGTAFATNGQQNFYVLVVGLPPEAGASGLPRPSVQESAPLYITPVQLAEPGEDGSIVHKVQVGQALWTLAASYDVDLDILRLINGLSEGDLLRPGDEVIIRLAEGQAPPPTPTPPLTHRVAEGETLWFIGWKYKISVDDLLWLNGLSLDALLTPGQELQIRLAPGAAPPPTATPQLEHIVQSGETAWSIAARYSLGLDTLYALNDLSGDSILRPGDRLLIRQPDPTATLPIPPTFTPAPTGTPAAAAPAASGAASAALAISPAPTYTPLPEPTLEPTLAGETASGNAGTGNIWLIAAGILTLGGAGLLASRRL
jgi:LysM repeat protein